ncbi:isocitrate lyase/phosphoenolpyruvate mutase family protein [Bradyrhizobium sp. LHD-71]|uniref:isocitrate lyase/phosphoenolpyruvate mutase family protein n=1 Tax=Bradyrhizobium sp. LHD-71 TaxID=3072141 RepID=UPI00280FF58F|nr:isocitrate lyase/phosphoenolpyruvate mutase family protein [Bradyrhizobium sp. LHD-71]MDQ8729140.1 isocitrate lyase/phosphoenolpyruvate mutase family protein [Bradyrhizobium sp. LHD-71]
MTGTRQLRTLMQGPGIVTAPDVFDGLTARLVEQAGFAAAYTTGAGTSASRGCPNFGLLTLTEMAENAGRLSETQMSAPAKPESAPMDAFRRFGADDWSSLRRRPTTTGS